MQAPQLLGRPEDLIKYGTSAEQSDSPLLGNLTKNVTAENTSEAIAEATPSAAFAKLIQESPKLKGAQGKIPSMIRTALPFASFSGAGGKGILPFLAFGGGYATGTAIDEGSQYVPGMDGEKFSTKLARGMAPEVFENADINSQPAFNAPTLQDLADQRAQNSTSEDDKVDSLQNALKGVPAGPQVSPGALPTPQEAGQGLMNAAKEFYPNASFEPAAPAAPALPDPARTGLSTEQMQGLSPDALQAIRTPSIPESVTSSEVPEGLGPLRPVNPQTGEILSPEVIAAGENAGLTFPSQVALPQVQAPVSAPPMSAEETQARLQERFGAPTLNQIQGLAEGQGRGAAVDAQGRMITPSAQPPADSAVPPAGALSSFEQDSLSRQQRIGGTGSFEGDSKAREDRLRENERRPGESQAGRDTRVANEKVTRSASAEGRAYTDSELRRAFGEDYQEAIIKDRNGINPFTDKTYADEELERQNLIEDTEARKRSGVDDPTESPTKLIEDARAQAEAMAAASGLSPDDPDYEDFILDSIETITGIPRYRKPPPKYADDAAADAAHAAGDLKVGDSFVMDGEVRVYAGPAPEEKTTRPPLKNALSLPGGGRVF